MTFDSSLKNARSLDAADPLASFRERFWIPEVDGKQQVYLVGNSLGLQPTSVADARHRRAAKVATVRRARPL